MTPTHRAQRRHHPLRAVLAVATTTGLITAGAAYAFAAGPGAIAPLAAYRPPSSCSASITSPGVVTVKWTRATPNPDHFTYALTGDVANALKVDGTKRSGTWTKAPISPTGGQRFEVRAAPATGTPSAWCVTAPTPDPSPTPTPTPTPTPSPTPTDTPTPTPTPPPTTDTPSPTDTPTPTVTPTPTPTPTSPTTTATPPPPGLDYEAGSYLYSAPGAEDGPLTAAMQSYITTTTDQKLAYPQLTGVNGNQWGMVFADGNASDPVWHVTGATIPDFHAAASLGADLTGTSDSPFVVNDHADGISIWGAGATQTGPNTISVTAAGWFVHGSNGLDKRNPLSDSTVNNVSRGRIPDTMVVTEREVAAAESTGSGLGHVLEIFWPATGGGHKSPMVGDEGDKGGWGLEGQRLALAPGTNLSTCSPVAHVIAQTFKDNGVYIGDNAGGGATIKMQQGGFAGLTAGALGSCGFTWADWIAVDN